MLTWKALQTVRTEDVHDAVSWPPTLSTNAKAIICAHISEGNGFKGLGWGNRGKRMRVPANFAYGLGRRNIVVSAGFINVFCVWGM